MSNNVKTVFISCCTRNKVEWGTSLSISANMQALREAKISSTLAPRVGESLICRARQNDIVKFRKSGMDYLFSVDDDIQLPEDAILKLIEADKDIIAGFYRLKVQSKAQTAIRLDKKGPDYGEILKAGIAAPAIYVSAGCMLIKQSVIEAMIKHSPELEYTRNLTQDAAWALYMPCIYKREYLSEDWAFCQRAVDAGFGIWCHGGVKCGHWGKIKYDFGE